MGSTNQRIRMIGNRIPGDSAILRSSAVNEFEKTKPIFERAK